MWDWIKTHGLKIAWGIITVLATALASWLGWDKLKPNPPEPGPILQLETKTNTAQVRDVISVTAKTKCPVVHWNYRGVSIKEVHQDALSLKLQVESPGILFIWAHGPYDGDSYGAVIEIAVAGPRPPPGPGPDPEPDPPKPPPEPDNALTLSLQNAFNLDTDADKSTKLPKLAGVMEAAALMANSPEARTISSFNKAIRTSTNTAIGITSLPRTRAAIGAYLETLLPDSDEPLNANTRKALNTGYSQVATALKKVR